MNKEGHFNHKHKLIQKQNNQCKIIKQKHSIFKNTPGNSADQRPVLGVTAAAKVP